MPALSLTSRTLSRARRASAIAGARRRRSWMTAFRTAGAIAAASSAAGANVGRIVGCPGRRFIGG